MPLSKHYLDTRADATAFSVDRLAADLQSELPEARFVYLHGSAAAGVVPPHGDLDLAVFLDPDLLRGTMDDRNSGGLRMSFVEAAVSVADRVVPGIRCDVGFLNGTEPVYRFEVLRGRLLFCRDREQWLSFYSRTCREYESQLFHYERQWRYRLEARP